MTLDELKFEPHPANMGGKRAVHVFPNGWEASVLFGGPFYTDGGTYELAVCRGNKLHYPNSVAQGDVRGHLSESDVNGLLAEIEAFSPDVAVVEAAYNQAED